MPDYEKQIQSLELHCSMLGKRISDLKSVVSSLEKKNQALICEYIDAKEIRLSKLRDDCIGVLKLLQEKDIVTKEELNKAIS